MGWADHMPKGTLDWDDPYPTHGGLRFGDRTSPGTTSSTSKT